MRYMGACLGHYGICTPVIIKVITFHTSIHRYGKLSIVKYLIEVRGCSAGCTDDSGLTLLHLACR